VRRRLWMTVIVLFALGAVGARSQAAPEVLEAEPVDEYDVIGTIDLDADGMGESSLAITLDSDQKEAQRVVRFERGAVTCLIGNGPLGDPVSLQAAKGEKAAFSIKRRRFDLSVLWNQQVVLRVADAATGGGELSYEMTGRPRTASGG
jgi:hypothetical protein